MLVHRAYHILEMFDVVEDEPQTKVPWISVDPDYPNLEKYPLFAKARPIQCVLRPGEVLYLPSMYLLQMLVVLCLIVGARVCCGVFC